MCQTNRNQPTDGQTKRDVESRSMRLNKAEYTATLVACGWAGAVLERSLGHLGRSCVLKKLKNAEKVKRGPNDRPTDRPTHRHSGVHV